MRKIFLSLLLLSMLIISLAWSSQPVHAQVEATATPSPRYTVSLSSGNVMVIERKITYGEIAIVIGLLSLVIIGGLFLMIRIFKK